MNEWRDKIGIGILHYCLICGTVQFLSMGPDTMKDEIKHNCPVCKTKTTFRHIWVEK